jgi:hypothetical protein
MMIVVRVEYGQITLSLGATSQWYASKKTADLVGIGLRLIADACCVTIWVNVCGKKAGLFALVKIRMEDKLLTGS